MQWNELLRAAWRSSFAPIAVVGLHLVLRRGFGLYEKLPGLDIPMHFLGGVAIAHFASRVLAQLEQAGHATFRSQLLRAGLVVALAGTAAVLWEFVEFSSDALLGSDAQGGEADTMGDLAMGLLGACLYVVGRALRRN